MNILVTGANGFVGSKLVSSLLKIKSFRVSVTTRRKVFFSEVCNVHYVTLENTNDLSDVLRSQDVVVHTAARTHIKKESSINILSEYRKVNVDATLDLARQAADLGVKRFIFISSIKVNGESTKTDIPFRSHDVPKPKDYYSNSKLEAENGLYKIAAETGLEVVIIRPPLLYGFGVKGNFESLVKIIRTGIPLPLASIKNNRSLLAIDNLVDLIIICINHPKAVNQIFLASDDHDISTPELLYFIANGIGKPLRLFRCPEYFLESIANIIGKKSITNRLLRSLQVDISNTKSLLNWSPPVKIEDAFCRCFKKF